MNKFYSKKTNIDQKIINPKKRLNRNLKINLGTISPSGVKLGANGFPVEQPQD